MSTLLSLDPIAEFDRMNRIFDHLFQGSPRSSRETAPATMVLPVDIFEKDGTLFVRAAVPGVKPEDLDVQIENNVLTVRGETRRSEHLENARVYRSEYSYGTFTRSIRLPEDLDLNKVDAQFENGYVTISMPRLPEEKPQALKVAVRPATPIEANPASENASN